MLLLMRAALAPLISWAARAGARVGGFRTTTQGYINYSIRCDAAGCEEDYQGLEDQITIQRIRKEIKEQRASEPAESLMIGDIARVVGGMLLYYCGERDSSFTISYDPRAEKEDRRVAEKLEEIILPLEIPLFGRESSILRISS